MGLIKIFNDNDIECSMGSCSEVYNEAVFNMNNRKCNASKLSSSSFAFKVDPTISSDYIMKNINKIKNVVEKMVFEIPTKKYNSSSTHLI